MKLKPILVSVLLLVSGCTATTNGSLNAIETHIPGYVEINTAAKYIYENVYCANSLVDADSKVTESLMTNLSKLSTDVVGRVSTEDGTEIYLLQAKENGSLLGEEANNEIKKAASERAEEIGKQYEIYSIAYMAVIVFGDTKEKMGSVINICTQVFIGNFRNLK